MRTSYYKSLRNHIPSCTHIELTLLQGCQIVAGSEGILRRVVLNYFLTKQQNKTNKMLKTFLYFDLYHNYLEIFLMIFLKANNLRVILRTLSTLYPLFRFRINWWLCRRWNLSQVNNLCMYDLIYVCVLIHLINIQNSILIAYLWAMSKFHYLA